MHNTCTKNIQDLSAVLQVITRIIRSMQYLDVASDVGVNFKNVGVLSIESSLFHLFHYTFFTN